MSRAWMGLLAGVFAMAAIIISSPARATVMVEVSLEDMIRDADAVVLATVERSGVQIELRDGDAERHTISFLRVQRWLVGEGGTRVRIRELGGVDQTGGRVIAGTPTYRAGEEVLVFLRKDDELEGAYRTYAMVQGKFTVRRGVPGVPVTVHRALETISFARWHAGQMTVEEARNRAPMQLDNVLDLIRDVRSLGSAR